MLCNYWLVLMDLAHTLSSLGIEPNPKRIKSMRTFFKKMGVEPCETCIVCKQMVDAKTPEDAIRIIGGVTVVELGAAFEKPPEPAPPPPKPSVISVGVRDGCGKCPSCIARKKAGN